MLLLHEEAVVPGTYDTGIFSFVTLSQKIPSGQLKTQYRTVPEICAVTNVVSNINIRTLILPPERAQMTRPARGVDAPPIIFNGLVRDF